MRVTFVIYSLSAGGAQRVVVDLAARLAARGHFVTLVTYSKKESDHFAVPAGVERVALDLLWDSKSLWQGLKSNVARLRMLRAALLGSRPDIVISFIDLTNILTIVSLLGTGIPIVISERIHPAHHAIGPRWRLARQLCYFLCSALVVQTQAVARWARRLVPSRRIQVIPNAAPEWTAVDMPARERTVLAVGRLHSQKGFDLLLDAFARSQIADDGWSLVLLGDGPERDTLVSMAEGLGVANRVRFVGITDEPRSWMNRCGIFVLSSRFEGFPNVLLEAMATGAPCIAFDCPSGPSEIIEPGANAMLVPPGDVAALARCLEALAQSPETRAHLGANACTVTEKYSAPRITDAWESLLMRLCKQCTAGVPQ